MSQLTIQLSDKADALIVQLQKEIFNRRRKKVPAEGVIETMLESAAKSQSDQRFATSWQNLIADIEKAASIAAAHGAKPANLSDEEWALVLSHRSRAAVAPSRRPASAKTSQARHAPATKPPAVAKEGATGRRVRSKPAVPSDRAVEAEGTEKVAAKAKPKSKPRVAKAVGAGEDKASVVKATARARTTTATPKTSAPAKPTAKARGAAPAKGAAPEKPKPRGSSSVARRMAKAVSRLGATAAESGGSPAATSSAPSMSKEGDHSQGSSGSGGLSS